MNNLNQEKALGKDTWENMYNGVGIQGKDPRLASVFTFRGFLTEYDCNSLYTDNGFAAKIVDRFVEDIMRKSFYVEGDEKGYILQRFDELELWDEIDSLLKWDRLHGGALMVLGFDDNMALDSPLDETNIRKLSFVRVYDRYEVIFDPIKDIFKDPNSKEYGKIEKYTVQPKDGVSYSVHSSRCIVLKGSKLPKSFSILNKTWGASIYQKGFTALRQLGDTYDSIEGIVRDFETQTISMEGLMNYIAAGKEDVIKQRLTLIDQGRSVYNTVLLDKDEIFAKNASTVTGLAEILEKYLQQVAGIYDIPVRILTGQQEGGLNNQGEGETRDWYDKVASKQRMYYTPKVLERLVKLLFSEIKGPFRGKEPETWSIVHNSLYEVSEKEIAEIKKINSETDCNYAREGILFPEEVAISRFGNDKYGEKIILDTKDRSIETEEEEE